jgi:hypothetical protein
MKFVFLNRIGLVYMILSGQICRNIDQNPNKNLKINFVNEITGHILRGHYKKYRLN